MPPGARVMVGLGSRATAGETILAEYGAAAQDRAYKVG